MVQDFFDIQYYVVVKTVNFSSPTLWNLIVDKIHIYLSVFIFKRLELLLKENSPSTKEFSLPHS